MGSSLWRGEKVRLTGLDKQDAGVIAAWYDDAGYLRLQESKLARPRSEAEMAADLERLRETKDQVVFGIRTMEGDELIGTVGFFEIEWANRTAWLGMGIGDRRHWEKGYGTEALGLGLGYAFNELNLHRISLTVFDYNERAIALYEKAGFKREGVFREFGQRDGKRYDMYLYGLLRPEWRAEVGDGGGGR